MTVWVGELENEFFLYKTFNLLSIKCKEIRSSTFETLLRTKLGRQNRCTDGDHFTIPIHLW
jgi:hypothetical protein